VNKKTVREREVKMVKESDCSVLRDRAKMLFVCCWIGEGKGIGACCEEIRD
jgi:hypothetical protein